MKSSNQLLDLVTALYGSEQAQTIAARIRALVADYAGHLQPRARRDSGQPEAILITYPDQVRSADRSPLAELSAFARAHLQGLVTGIHVLPCYPWSSDDGFAVVDSRRVAPEYGSWDDLHRLDESFELMLDAVVNHASAQSPWFHLFLQGRVPYRDYFLTMPEHWDLSRVVRPRTTPLATAFGTGANKQSVWTTFGPDQADFNYRSPDLLLEMLDLLLFYVSQGARLIRLDAVGFLWKESGTSCMNLPQTHTLVELMHCVVSQVDDSVRLVTESNVPQDENLAYFGDGTNEADLIYNFSLPPLILHAFWRQSARTLAAWLSSMPAPPGRATYLNILATHDGVGLNPLRGIVPGSDVDGIADRCLARGGLISYKRIDRASTVPYELNMNYLDALDALGPSVSPSCGLDRFMTAHAIMFALPGIPAIYFHSLFGSRGWTEGVLASGQKRRVNRQRLTRESLERELGDPAGLRARVFGRMSALLHARAAQTALGSTGTLEVLDSGGPVLGLARRVQKSEPPVICLYNLSPSQHQFAVPWRSIGKPQPRSAKDLITGSSIDVDGLGKVALGAYQSLWLLPNDRE